MQIYLRHGEQYSGADTLEGQAQTRAERLRRFWILLEETMRGYPIPHPSGRPFTILDLACGVCEEARVLNAFFATGIAGMPSSAARLFGIDQSEGNVDSALVSCNAFDPFFYNPLYYISMQGEFVAGDATRLDEFAETPETFDFVLMRHQFTVRSPEAVKTMVTKALARLTASGKFLFTSFTRNEHVALLAMLAELPVEILVERENPAALPVRGEYMDGDVAIDKFVCLIRKTLVR